MPKLILKRRVGESIRIGKDILVTVTELVKRSGEMRLTIEAPADVEIWRTELLEKAPGGTDTAASQQGDGSDLPR